MQMEVGNSGLLDGATGFPTGQARVPLGVGWDVPSTMLADMAMEAASLAFFVAKELVACCANAGNLGLASWNAADSTITVVHSRVLVDGAKVFRDKRRFLASRRRVNDMTNCNRKCGRWRNGVGRTGTDFSRNISQNTTRKWVVVARICILGSDVRFHEELLGENTCKLAHAKRSFGSAPRVAWRNSKLNGIEAIGRSDAIEGSSKLEPTISCIPKLLQAE